MVAARGVLPDIVRDGETGIVAHPGPEPFAEGIVEMAALDAAQRAEWGRAARQRMADYFRLARQGERMLDVYERVLAGA